MTMIIMHVQSQPLCFSYQYILSVGSSSYFINKIINVTKLNMNRKKFWNMED